MCSDGPDEPSVPRRAPRVDRTAADLHDFHQRAVQTWPPNGRIVEGMGQSARMRSKARWAVPAVAAVAIAGAVAGPRLLASADSNGLPSMTPQQLVAAVANRDTAALSGTVSYTARLGLPSFSFGSGSAGPANLLSGTTTMRVRTDGHERSRVSLQGRSEYAVVADGPEAWTYSGAQNAVVHWTLDPADAKRLRDAHDMAGSGDVGGVAPGLPTPGRLASQALAHVEKFSTVTVDGQSMVAGRDAYRLVVTPKTAETLVDRVVVAVDAKTKTPLRVQVWSTRGTQRPALEVGFTSVSFTTPPRSALTFTPPKGAAVQEKVVRLPADHAAAPWVPGGLPPGVTVQGTGWSTVVEAALPAGDGMRGMPQPGGRSTSGPGMLGRDGGAAGLAGLARVVPEGRLLSSPLLSVLITHDDRVLAGAVPAATLQRLA
jgi:hypothetical protein